MGGDGKKSDNLSASGSSKMGGDEDSLASTLHEVSMTNKRGRAVLVQIATGRNHVLALDKEGNVYAWGNNKFGQCATPDLVKDSKDDHEAVMSVNKPTRVEGALNSHEVCQIYAGNKQSYAVTRQGKIFVWGSNENNLLGLGLGEKKDERGGGDDCVKQPKELLLSKIAPDYFTGGSKNPTKADPSKTMSDKNPFKKVKKSKNGMQHEGFNKRVLVTDSYKNNLTIYSAQRVV